MCDLPALVCVAVHSQCAASARHCAAVHGQCMEVLGQCAAVHGQCVFQCAGRGAAGTLRGTAQGTRLVGVTS